MYKMSNTIYRIKGDIKTSTNLIPGSVQSGVQFLNDTVISVSFNPGEFPDDKVVNNETIIYTLPCKRDKITKKVIKDVDNKPTQYYLKSYYFFRNNQQRTIPVTVIIKIKDGYKIEGLFNVSDLKTHKGKDGFYIYTVKLTRISNTKNIIQIKSNTKPTPDPNPKKQKKVIRDLVLNYRQIK